MADSKISALPALSGANVAQDDVLPIVDTSTVTTKKISMAQLQAAFKGTGGISTNVVLGDQAGNSITTGSNNVSFGTQAGYTNKTGSYNVIIGDQAGYLFDYSGGVSQNTFVGQAAGYNATQILNTFLGSRSGFYVTSGTRNTILGRFDGNQDSLDIRTTSSNIVLADGDGNVPVYADSSSNWNIRKGNLIIGTAAKGVNFTANTPAAGMTSQLLNWYEEGTFTAVANVLGSGTITLNTNTCYYTRIGRQVTVTGAISVLSVSSPTGDTQIAGFPFTAGRPSAVALQGTGFAATASTALVARLDASTTGFYVFHFAVGTSSGSAADFQAGSSLNFSCTYFI